MLGTEHDNLRVGVDLYIVSRRPIEQVVGIHRFSRAIRVGRNELAAQNEAPVRALALIAFQSLEERSGVNARREGEVLAAYLVESLDVAKLGSLTDYRPWNFHP